jgi:hypothetical protein
MLSTHADRVKHIGRPNLFWHEHEGPVVGRAGQIRSYRILQDILGFFTPAFIAAQTVIKEITLPVNFCAYRRVSFRMRHNIFHLGIHCETREEMNMIRHQHKQMDEPLLLSLIEPDRFE